jgi:WD40 repeat protein
MKSATRPSDGSRHPLPPRTFSDVIVSVLFANGDGQTIVVAARAGTIVKDNIASGATSTLRNASEITDVSLSPDGRLIAAADIHGGITRWDVANQTSVELPHEHGGRSPTPVAVTGKR